MSKVVMNVSAAAKVRAVNSHVNMKRSIALRGRLAPAAS
jgi:hypothetical protein